MPQARLEPEMKSNGRSRTFGARKREGDGLMYEPVVLNNGPS